MAFYEWLFSILPGRKEVAISVIAIRGSLSSFRVLYNKIYTERKI